MGVKQILLMIVVVALVGCGGKDSPEPQAKTPEASKVDVNTTPTPKTQPKVEAKNPQPSKAIPANIDDPILEKAIREELNKPTGELTQVDLEKVYNLALYGKQLTELPKGLEKLTQLEILSLHDNQLTDLKGLEKLPELLFLSLGNNPALTKAQIEELQKALPKCEIDSNPTK